MTETGGKKLYGEGKVPVATVGDGYRERQVEHAEALSRGVRHCRLAPPPTQKTAIPRRRGPSPSCSLSRTPVASTATRLLLPATLARAAASPLPSCPGGSCSSSPRPTRGGHGRLRAWPSELEAIRRDGSVGIELVTLVGGLRHHVRVLIHII